MSSQISVIIPSYGRPDVLNRCINSISEQEYENFEIILIHQGAPHPEYEIENLNMITYDKPIGSTRAKNKGVEVADGDIITFVDDDIIPKTTEWLSEFHTEFENSDEDVGAVGGYIDEPTTFLEERGETGQIDYNQLGFYRIIPHFQASVRQQVDHLKIGNTAVKQNVFDDLEKPYFDPAYGGNAHREETDFFLRVRDVGYSLYFTPKCAVDHLQPESGGQLKVLGGSQLKSAWWHGRNETRLFCRHFHAGILSTVLFVLQEAVYKPRVPHNHLAKMAGVFSGLLVNKK